MRRADEMRVQAEQDQREQERQKRKQREREKEKVKEKEMEVSFIGQTQKGGGVHSDQACLGEHIEKGGKAKIGCACLDFRRFQRVQQGAESCADRAC